eukprot:gene17803-32333_t
MAQKTGAAPGGAEAEGGGREYSLWYEFDSSPDVIATTAAACGCKPFAPHITLASGAACAQGCGAG